MSRSRLTAAGRSALLLAAGMLAAQTVGGAIAAGPVSPQATIQTRTVSCNGLNFHPISSNTKFDWVVGSLYRSGTTGDGYFLCDPQLPHRATVTRVRFTVLDGSDNAEVRYCALFRRPSAPDRVDEDAQVVADAGGTGVAATPEWTRLSASPVSGRATVDNATYSYVLQCQINFTASGNIFARIYSADVTYKISSVNG